MNLMSRQFLGQFDFFTKIIALKTLVKSITVSFIVKYIYELNETKINNMNVKCVMP